MERVVGGREPLADGSADARPGERERGRRLARRECRLREAGERRGGLVLAPVVRGGLPEPRRIGLDRLPGFGVGIFLGGPLHDLLVALARRIAAEGRVLLEEREREAANLRRPDGQRGHPLEADDGHGPRRRGGSFHRRLERRLDRLWRRVGGEREQRLRHEEGVARLQRGREGEQPEPGIRAA